MDENLIRRIRVAARALDASRDRLLDFVAELGGAGNAPRAQSLATRREGLASLQLAVARPPSFGDALLAEDFQPTVGAKIAPRRSISAILVG